MRSRRRLDGAGRVEQPTTPEVGPAGQGGLQDVGFGGGDQDRAGAASTFGTTSVDVLPDRGGPRTSRACWGPAQTSRRPSVPTYSSGPFTAKLACSWRRLMSGIQLTTAGGSDFGRSRSRGCGCTLGLGSARASSCVGASSLTRASFHAIPYLLFICPTLYYDRSECRAPFWLQCRPRVPLSRCPLSTCSPRARPARHGAPRSAQEGPPVQVTSPAWRRRVRSAADSSGAMALRLVRCKWAPSPQLNCWSSCIRHSATWWPSTATTSPTTTRAATSSTTTGWWTRLGTVLRRYPGARRLLAHHQHRQAARVSRWLWQRPGPPRAPRFNSPISRRPSTQG